jgi:hypothetical protein
MARVIHTELPPERPKTSYTTSPTKDNASHQKKRVTSIPHKPHKPFTSSNFYDLTKSSPVISPPKFMTIDLTSTTPEVTPRSSIPPRPSSGFLALQQIDRANHTIPGPIANQKKLQHHAPLNSTTTHTNRKVSAPSSEKPGFRKGSRVLCFELTLFQPRILWIPQR